MRALFTTWEGGGHVPPALLVARRLQAQGAEVLFVSDEATRAAARAAHLMFEPWRTAPNRGAGGQADDPLDDWKALTPVGVVRSVCKAVMCGPAERYAVDTLDLITRFKPDVIVTNELLFGVLAAAEHAGVPAALLTGNLWCFPTRPDLPPFGPAFPPAATPFEVRREAMARGMIHRLYDLGLADLNRARRGLRLPPLGATLDQLRSAGLTVLGVARAFDYGDGVPTGVVYAGPLGAPPSWAADAAAPGVGDDPRPLVLVSFSTTYQREEAILARCVEALGRLPVRGLVTLGPALAEARLPVRENVQVVERASHDAIVANCAAVLCHGGHGTVIRPLMHGVPVVCIPTGRDQPENARRIAVRGAGLTLSRGATTGAIANAVRSVVFEPRYAEAARTLGRAIRTQSDGGARAADAIIRFSRLSVAGSAAQSGPNPP